MKITAVYYYLPGHNLLPILLLLQLIGQCIKLHKQGILFKSSPNINFNVAYLYKLLKWLIFLL